MSNAKQTGLVVEDEWLIRLELVEELTSAGWAVRDSGSGEDALMMIAKAQAEGQKMDFLVTDIRLGGAVDGWDVAESCRKAWPGLAVIYVSANPMVESRRVEGGTMLSKPAEMKNLISLCRRLIAGQT
jgi:DNA-binding response OmpR family regulator